MVAAKVSKLLRQLLISVQEAVTIKPASLVDRIYSTTEVSNGVPEVFRVDSADSLMADRPPIVA